MQPVFCAFDKLLGIWLKSCLSPLSEIEKNKVFKKFHGNKAYLPYGAKDDEPAVLNPMFEGYRYHFTGLHHGPTGHPTEDAVVCSALDE